MGSFSGPMDGLRGKFLVLDGPDGGGKTTVGRLLARHLTDAGLSVVQCRDPGGTKVGDRIRSVLLDFDLASMDIRCETFLFMASRAQLVAEIIRPALAAGKLVLCDRFISATCALSGGFGSKRSASGYIGGGLTGWWGDWRGRATYGRGVDDGSLMWSVFSYDS